MATNYRGSLVVNEEEEAQSNGDSCGDVVDDEADVDDVEGGAPDPDSQKEKVAEQVEVDLSVPVGCGSGL